MYDLKTIEKVNRKTQDPPSFAVVDAIIDYENGSLDEEGTIELFQHLVDTGMAWTLQGCYGRTALMLIKAGLVSAKVAS